MAPRMLPGNKIYNGNHFFKIMVPGYMQKLRIPKVFSTKRLNQMSNHKHAKLSKRDKTWHVQVKSDDEEMWFKKGWKEFASENEIKLGDLLVFEHKGEMIFDVLIFDQSACEKDYCSSSKTTNTEASENKRSKTDYDEDPLEAAAAYTTSRPHFIKKIAVYNTFKCPPEIPIQFARSNGLCHCKGRKATLRGPLKKNLQDVDIRVGREPSQRVRFGSVIFRFLKENNIGVGDVCVFELDPTAKKKGRIVFDVKVFNGQTRNVRTKNVDVLA